MTHLPEEKHFSPSCRPERRGSHQRCQVVQSTSCIIMQSALQDCASLVQFPSCDGERVLIRMRHGSIARLVGGSPRPGRRGGGARVTSQSSAASRAARLPTSKRVASTHPSTRSGASEKSSALNLGSSFPRETLHPKNQVQRGSQGKQPRWWRSPDLALGSSYRRI